MGHPGRHKARHTRAEVRQKNAYACGRVRNDSGRHLHSRAPLEETGLAWRNGVVGSIRRLGGSARLPMICVQTLDHNLHRNFARHDRDSGTAHWGHGTGHRG